MIYVSIEIVYLARNILTTHFNESFISCYYKLHSATFCIVVVL
jgi:hypothetical protein